MVRNSKKKEEKPKDSPFKKFIKKRAPVYLSVIAIVVIFIVPELTKGDLQSNLPENLSEEEQLVLDTLMSYNGPNKEGLSIKDAISNQIDEKYPNEKIFDNKKTNINVSISKLDTNSYQVVFDFESYKEDFHYNWNIDMESKIIKGVDEDSKYIIDLVDFYD